MPKPKKETQKRNTVEWDSSAIDEHINKIKSKREQGRSNGWDGSVIEDYINSRRSLREQKQYQDNFTGPQPIGGEDAMKANYYGKLANYGATYNDPAAYDEGYRNYRKAMYGVNKAYNDEVARNQRIDAVEDKIRSDIGKFIPGSNGAESEYNKQSRRTERDTELYGRMSQTANQTGSQSLYDRASKGFTQSVSDLADAYSRYETERNEKYNAEQAKLKEQHPDQYYRNAYAEGTEEVHSDLEWHKQQIESALRSGDFKLANDRIEAMVQAPLTAEDREQATKYIDEVYEALNATPSDVRDTRGMYSTEDVEQYRKSMEEQYGIPASLAYDDIDKYNFAVRYAGKIDPASLDEQYGYYQYLMGGQETYQTKNAKNAFLYRSENEIDNAMKNPIASGAQMDSFTRSYQAINDLNMMLDMIDNVDMSANADNYTVKYLAEDLKNYGVDLGDLTDENMLPVVRNALKEQQKKYQLMEAALKQSGFDTDLVRQRVDYEQKLRYDEDRQKSIHQWAQSASGWDKAAMTGGAIAEDVFLAPAEYLLGTLPKVLSGKKERDVNTYVPLTGSTSQGDLLKNEIGKTMSEKGKFLYDTAISGIESALGGLSYGEAGYLLAMGLRSADAKTNEILQKGGSRDQAIWGGVAAGAIEAASEVFSLQELIKLKNATGIKQIVKGILTTAGFEASEEIVGGIADAIIDPAILGNLSDKSQSIMEYMNSGMSYDEAVKQAWTDQVLDTLKGALSAGISAGVSGPIYATAGKIAGYSNEFDQAIYEERQNKRYEKTGASLTASESSALQAFAQANNIEYNEKTTQKSEETSARTERKNNRELGSVRTQVVSNIQEQMAGKTVQEQQAIRDKMIEEYGSGIAPSVYEAISMEAAKKAASLNSADAVISARSEALQDVKDADMRRAITDGYDQAAFYKAMATDNANEAGRYFQHVRNTARGEMSMQATVSDENGQSKQVDITGMSNDGKSVVLSDGVKIDVSDLQTDADTLDVIQKISDLQLGDKTDKVFQEFKKTGLSGSDGYRWIMDYATAYNQGRTGAISLQDAVKRSSLDAETVMDAYQMGQQEIYSDTQKAVNKVKSMPKKAGATGHVANIDVSRIEGKTMTKQEREQFDFANKVFAAAGVDVEWFASDVKDGLYVGENGSYKDGKIRMDIHAGKNSFLNDVNSGIMATVGHELTHFLQQYAPEQYAAMKKFLFQQIVSKMKGGEAALERLIWEKQKRSNNNLSRKAAEDEVVADACQTMLRDSKAIHEFAKQNEDAVKSMARWLDKWFSKLKSIFSRSANLSEEARFVNSLEKDIQKAFGELWDEAMREAVSTHDRVGNMEKPATDGGEQFSRRQDVLDRNDVAWMGDFTSIKDQLEAHRDEISDMAPVAEITYAGEDKDQLVDLIMDQIPALGGGRMIRDGISFEFDRNGAKYIVLHARSEELRAAALAAPFVAKKGKLIAGQKNHEGTNTTTLTYAAPAIINGEPVNVGLVIQFTSNGRPRAVNVETENGGVFRIEKTAQGLRSRTGKSQVTQLLTRAVSDNKISQTAQEVKSQNSDRDYNSTVILEESTIDKYLRDYASKTSPNYAQAYIVRMSPNDFLNLTTSMTGRDTIWKQTGELDVDKLKKATIDQPFQLNIDTKTGQVEGHEGRHRAMALYNNGVNSVPVLLFDSSNKYDKTSLASLELKGQDFGKSRSDATVTVQDVQPLSYANRDNVVQKFTTQPTAERMGEKYGGKETIRYSLRPVEDVKPRSNAWERGATFDEVKAKHPTLFALNADESDTRNPTQVKVTVSTYKKIYEKLKAEGFKGTILDASSGLGLGTQVGRDDYGFKVDDIEPFPDKSYKPMYTDYSTLDKTYDAIISNAVLNVIPQDLRDAMVVKIGEMLNPGGRAFINVRGDDVLNAGSKVPINEKGMEYFISNTGSYQKGFTKSELKAYLEDALGSDFDVKIGNSFGKVSAVVTKKAGAQFSEREAAAKADVELYTQNESAAPEDGTLFSERTWTASRFVQDKENAAKALAKALGVTIKKAKKYVDDINSVARMIADDRARLDYMSSPGRSAFKSNAEYGGSIDFSTLCKKRQLLTGTFNAIQHALANTVLTAEDVLHIRQMMQDAGLEVNCGMCYVEGSRARMGEYNKTFLELYQKYYPDNWQPKMEDVNTTDGLELMRMEHPECYEQYEYFYNNHGTLRAEDKAIFSSQAKPKEYQLRTEYKGEIAEKFQKDSTVEAKNRNGGLRMQSFSDFEIVHLIDCMQVIMDMSEVGLAGQAYTKVPEFAEALGLTGLKINLSLVAKGVDSNGNLIFNDVEGMPHERAFGIREKYSENVGTILVVYDDAQLLAALKDPKVDFIIPFHRSQWKKSQYAAMGLPATTKDYTNQQNEKWLNPKDHTHEYRDKTVPTKCTNYMPNEYWDFNLSGKSNAERYLAMCAKDGKRPKFYKLLQNNGDGTYSLKADGSTDGYWKLLIDFKMYDNEGHGAEQRPVQPIFDMDNAQKMLADYSGDPSRFPVAQGIVNEFVAHYKAEHPGRQYSMRDYDNTLSDYDLIMGIDEADVEGLDPKAQLRETKQRITRVQALRDKLAQARAERDAAEKKVKELTKPGTGKFAQQMRAAKAEAELAAEKANAKAWSRIDDLTAKQLEKTIREKRSVERALEKQIQREEDILAGKLKPLAMQRMLKAAKDAQYAKDQQRKEEQFAGYKDRQLRGNIRARIKNLHSEMQRDLLNPREGHYVPQSLIRPVVDLLDLVNTQTNRAKSEDAQARIAAINAAYDQLKKDERYSQYYDETVKDMLVELSQTLAGRSIYELSSAELEDVYTAMKAMRTTIRNSIKADLIEKGKEIWQVGNELRKELRAGKGASPLLLEKYHMAMLSPERAFHRFGGYMPNSMWDKTFRMLDDAQLKALTLEMLGTRIFDPVLSEKQDRKQAEALTSYKDKDLVDVGLKDSDGNAVPITRGMMLSLYMHMQNEENMRHLMYGGLTLPDYKRYYNGSQEAWGRGIVEIPALGAKVSNLDELLESKGEAYVDNAYADYKAEVEEMFKSIRQNIEDQLTDYDRKWIAASKQFFDVFSRQVLNEVTNEMYGFSKAKVDNYFPIVTDPNFLKSEFDSISRNISLENAGFMKERVRAGNPILLEDITRAVNRQISNVSRYAGLTQALKTFGNVYNVQTKGFTDSVKKAMAQTYGKNGQSYVQNLITDMVGGRSQPGSIFDKIKGNYAQAILSANIPVSVKQAASFPTAAATVGWGPILKALAKGGKDHRLISRADKALINTYTPLLWKRSQGSVDVEIGDIAKGRSWAQKTPALMGWITGIDKMTVGRLWSAAEYYVEDNYNLQKGTEQQIKNGESPFYKKVAEVFNQIVEDTQPNYTTLQRPDILRNPNKLLRAMTMFTTQRLQNANIILDAANEYLAMRKNNKAINTTQSQENKALARKKLSKAITSQIVSTITLGVMDTIAKLLQHRVGPYRDDDDEFSWDEVAKALIEGFIETITGSFLWGSEVYKALDSIFTGSKYYENDVAGISTINNVVSSAVKFSQKAIQIVGKDDFEISDLASLAKKQLLSLAEDVSQLTGVPLANVKKIVEGGYYHVKDVLNGEFLQFESDVDRTNAVNARRYYKAWMAADEVKMDKVLDELVHNTNGDEDKIRNAVTKPFREAYKSGDISLEQYTEFITDSGFFTEKQQKDRISDIAKDAFDNGAMTEDEAVTYLSGSGFWDENDAWMKVQGWVAKQEHADDEDYNFSQYDAIDEAIDANKDINDFVNDLTSHGVKAENVTSHIKQHLVDNYVKGGVTESALKNQLSRYCGIVTKDDVDKIVNDANCRKETGYAYSNLGEAYRSGKVDSSTLRSALTKYGGMSASDANKRIRWYDLQISKPDLEITEATCNAWYDGTAKSKENTHESAKSAGMSIEAYMKAKAELDKIKDANDNNTGEDEVIAALAKMNLTPRQKDALYYERYKGTTKYSKKTW